MKLTRKITAILMAILMVTLSIAFTSCGTPAETTADTSAESVEDTTIAAETEKYTIGICQLVQHVALDAATQGFKDAIVEELGAENVEFLEANAQGDPTVCTTIVNDHVTKKVDLIMANATAALQAAANGTMDIPVLGTSVTDYATALEIDNFTGVVGGNVSGTCDLAPIDGQAEMLLELYPEAKTVGMLYCSAEPNSQYQVDLISKMLTDKGITCVEYSFADSNDVATVSAAAAVACDVLYIPTDNTAAYCTEAINGAVLPTKTPIIAGEAGICGGCGVATLSIDYYDLGVKTGKMAVEILTGKADISEMAVATADTATKKYNPVNCKELGIDTAALEAKGYVALEG